MPQFNRCRILGEVREEPAQTIPRGVVTMKAGGKLKEDASEFPCRSQRSDTLLEDSQILRQDRRFSVGEVLPGLHGEFKAWGRAFCPAFRRFGVAGVIEGRIDFDRIEVTGIEAKLVGLSERIEDTGPRSGAGARRIAPTARADPPDAGVIAFRRLLRERWQERQWASPYP